MVLGRLTHPLLPPYLQQICWEMFKCKDMKEWHFRVVRPVDNVHPEVVLIIIMLLQASVCGHPAMLRLWVMKLHLQPRRHLCEPMFLPTFIHQTMLHIYSRATHVSNDQARHALRELASNNFCWGSKAAQDMTISSITSSSGFHVGWIVCTDKQCLCFILHAVPAGHIYWVTQVNLVIWAIHR